MSERVGQSGPRPQVRLLPQPRRRGDGAASASLGRMATPPVHDTPTTRPPQAPTGSYPLSGIPEYLAVGLKPHVEELPSRSEGGHTLPVVLRREPSSLAGDPLAAATAGGRALAPQPGHRRPLPRRRQLRARMPASPGLLRLSAPPDATPELREAPLSRGWAAAPRGEAQTETERARCEQGSSRRPATSSDWQRLQST